MGEGWKWVCHWNWTQWKCVCVAGGGGDKCFLLWNEKVSFGEEDKFLPIY